MAVLVLCSTTHYAIDLHFCQNHLVNLSINGKAESCHKVALADLNSHCGKRKGSCVPSASFDGACDKGCCSNQNLFVNGLDLDIVLMTECDLSDYHDDFNSAIEPGLRIAVDQTRGSPQVHNLYKPPQVPKIRHILHQSFLN